MANIKSFPNNQDEYIGAEEVMRWLHGRTSGVFGAEGNAAVAPVLDSMAVTVSDGNGWISNANADGVVWWIDNEKVNGSKLQLSVDMADAVLPRIDRVIVSWQTTNYVALPEVKILKGTAASNPVAPALTNNSTLRQISLAAIKIPAGSTAITAAMITDERLNKSVCGIVTDSVAVDTSMVNSQMTALLNKIEKNLTEITSGEIPTGAVSQTFTGTLLASGWTATAWGAYQQLTFAGSGIIVYSSAAANNQHIEVGLDTSAFATNENPNAIEADEAWANIFRAIPLNNGVQFNFKEVPTIDIPVYAWVVNK